MVLNKPRGIACPGKGERKGWGLGVFERQKSDCLISSSVRKRQMRRIGLIEAGLVCGALCVPALQHRGWIPEFLSCCSCSHSSCRLSKATGHNRRGDRGNRARADQGRADGGEEKMTEPRWWGKGHWWELHKVQEQRQPPKTRGEAAVQWTSARMWQERWTPHNSPGTEFVKMNCAEQRAEMEQS